MSPLPPRSARAAAWLSAALAVAACDTAVVPGEAADAAPITDADPPEDRLLDDPLAPLPATMSEIGLYPALPDLSHAASEAHAYRPTWELWSNGSVKQRHLVLPAGEVIDNEDPGHWVYPLGTLLFKTFSYPDEDHPRGARAIETRVLRRAAGGWDHAAYRWRDDGADADRLDPARAEAVAVRLPSGAEILHEIPSGLECRMCHESSPSVVLGLGELQLADAAEPGVPSQLERLVTRGLLARAPSQPPPRIDHPDEATARVLGYLHGNCVHCHNGSAGPSSSFDLRHQVALDNLIDQEGESSAGAPGIRVVPGEPSESLLYLAMSREVEGTGVKAMPPVGVQLRDDESLDLVHGWILGLALEPEAP